MYPRTAEFAVVALVRRSFGELGRLTSYMTWTRILYLSLVTRQHVGCMCLNAALNFEHTIRWHAWLLSEVCNMQHQAQAGQDTTSHTMDQQTAQMRGSGTRPQFYIHGRYGDNGAVLKAAVVE